MKFKFCSEGDCPLWALAALHALSSLPAALFRTLLQHVMEEQPDMLNLFIFINICLVFPFGFQSYWMQLGTGIFHGVLLFVVHNSDDGIMEILRDTSFSSRDECARAAAVIRWVVQQSCAGDCTGAQLMRDLLVLGVPRTHANALADAVDNYRPEHVAHVQANGFMINKLTDVSVNPGPEGTEDTIILTMHSDDVFTGEQKKRDLLIEKSQALTLLEELKKVYKKMEEIED